MGCFKWSVLSHPPYSLYLTPSDYGLPSSIPAKCFSLLTSSRVCQKSFFIKNKLNSTPKASTSYKTDKWQQIIASNGEYIIDWDIIVVCFINK